MSIDVTIPEFSESVSEGTVGAWLKQVGEEVVQGETLVEVETDKVVLEIPAPANGVLEKIIKTQNDVVASNEVIGTLTEGASDKPAVATVAKKPENIQQEQPSEPPVTDNKEHTASKPASQAKTSPAVRKMMQEHDLKIEDIDPTGKGNRITKEDVLRNIGAQSDLIAVPPAIAQLRETERVPMSSLRKRIAERLVSAQQDYAMLTTFNEVNMQRVLEIREKYKDKFLDQHGVKLGFMSFFVLAAVEALKEYPVINASVEAGDIVYHRYMDIGIAVSSERGLVVPIVRGAGAKSLAAIELELNELAGKARDNKLAIEELTGGTFTITNGGVFGSMLSTPIINPPQSAILGMHAIEKRPVVINDEIKIRPMMYLALSYDHRIIDGRDAVLFLSRIKKIIEDPVQLLLHM